MTDRSSAVALESRLRAHLGAESVGETPRGRGAALVVTRARRRQVRRRVVAVGGGVALMVILVVFGVNRGLSGEGLDPVEERPGPDEDGPDSIEPSPDGDSDQVDVGEEESDGVVIVSNPFPGASPDDGGATPLPPGPEMVVGEVVDVSDQVTRVEDNIEVPSDDPASMTSFSGPVSDGAGSDWVGANRENRGFLVRLDSVTNDVVATIEIGAGTVHVLGVGEGAVWVARNEEERGDLVRVDVVTGEVVATIEIGVGRVGGAGIVDGAVWVTGDLTLWSGLSDATHRKALYRVDPATNTVVAVIDDFPPFQPFGHAPRASLGVVAVSDDAVWLRGRVDERLRNTVFLVDPATDSVVAAVDFLDRNAGRDSTAIADDALWVSGFNGVVYRVDEASGAVETIDLQVRKMVEEVVVGHDAVWAVTASSLYRIDPTTNSFSVLHGPPNEVTGLDVPLWDRLTGNMVLVDNDLFVRSINKVGSVNISARHLLRIDTSTLSVEAAYLLGDDIDGYSTVVDDILRVGSLRIPLEAVSSPPDD